MAFQCDLLLDISLRVSVGMIELLFLPSGATLRASFVRMARLARDLELGRIVDASNVCCRWYNLGRECLKSRLFIVTVLHLGFCFGDSHGVSRVGARNTYVEEEVGGGKGLKRS